MSSQSETTEDLPVLKGFMTISKAAAILGISRAAAHQMARQRKLLAWQVESASQDNPVVVDSRQVEQLRKGRHQVVQVP